MKAHDIMTAQPACCMPDDSAKDAARVMKENDCGCVPVVERDTGHLIGVVTDRDLAVRGVAEGKGAEVRVEDLMTVAPSCCSSEDDVTVVELLMANNQVRRVPVVDDEGRCVGIIAQADLARAMLVSGSVSGQDLATVVERVSRPPRWASLRPSGNFQPPL
jgi:CBS domain-containing protein